MNRPFTVPLLRRSRTSGWFAGMSGLALVASATTFTAACGSEDGEAPAADEPTNVERARDGGATGSSPPPGAFDNGDSGDSPTETADDSCKKMDIVFVVDNSSSMAQEQANLAQNFPKFGAIIDGYKTKGGASLDYRLAVTTTDLQANKGAFVQKNGNACDAGPDRPWIERGDAKPSDFFACRAQVGTHGSSFEFPLAALNLALTDRIKDGTNASNGGGFLRDDALLAFVVLTDEDESGNTPAIEDYPPSFDKLKGGERGRWAAAVIAGETACKSKQLGNATEAKKLKQFIGDVGPNGVFSSICEGDLTPGLTKALDTFGKACKAFPSGPK